MYLYKEGAAAAAAALCCYTAVAAAAAAAAAVRHRVPDGKDWCWLVESEQVVFAP